MTPTKHKRGNWFFWVPAKFSPTGKRECVYKKSKNAAYNEIQRLKDEWREHGKSAITDEDRTYIGMARAELGDLKLLPEVLRHWRLTGPGAVVKMTLADAITKYLEFRATLGLDRRTLRDTKSAMRRFAFQRDWCNVHEITAAEIRAFIDERGAPLTRKTAYKHQRLFWDWAKSERLVTTDLMENIRPPVVRGKEAEVYTPDQFEKLLQTADANYRDLLPFLCLSGFGFMRTGELVSAYSDKPTLKWEHVLWSEGKVYVPTDVGKQTRRAVGNQREFPICEALSHWLEPYKGRAGRIVELNEAAFRARMSELFKAAGVAKLDNGLRKSAISHYIAKFPETGVTLTARYAGNSESIARTHYLAWLAQETGEKWFGIRRR
jgi:hypothetical protein